MDKTFMLNNYTFNNVPAWAKAENMEQAVGLNRIWNMSNKVQKTKQHLLRKKVAVVLYNLANVIDERVEEKGCTCAQCKVQRA